MRIHSDKITSADLWDAMYGAETKEDGRMYLFFTEHGSRKRARAFEVGLQGDGTRNKLRRNSGTRGADKSGYAATWEAWGRFLAYLFKIDPDMVTTYYADENDFHSKTEGQFLVSFGTTPFEEV